MNILIISVGKKHTVELAAAINEYQKRLSRDYNIEWLLIKPSSLDPSKARLVESRQIATKLRTNDVTWLLDERGEQISSPALSNKLNVLKTHYVGRLVIIIGGAHGVDDELRQKVSWQWSLSKLVFPHQLVRLILTEQLYRSSQIERGSRYHHA